MKKFCLVILFLAIFVGAFFFNAWYVQKLYEIGLIPLMTLFNIELPLISYKVFVVILFFSSCVITAFKYDTKNKDNTTDAIRSDDEALTKFMGDVFGMVLTKLLNLLILSLLIGLIF